MKKILFKRGGFVLKAFTLVELLVVIAVIALLMGILMPVLSRARNAATSTACQANLRSIAYGFVMYLDDNRDIMPEATIMPFDGATDPSIMDFLERYLSEPKVFECPGDRKERYYDDYGTSYAYNTFLGGTTVDKSLFARMTRSKAVNIHVMRDFGAFHKKKGEKGAFNYLYADGHVGDNRKQH